eukprot:CAMPEP_0175788398 /NCGR_PEP_ID=MMETSP0097-20121207/80860_1 /TAXON_ID=311494 /ORGANISM="Alexandrium monilatum, Strain CCMP3105" /LENGTH=70 /DNA_ID=CAMNT_0017099413 /DNA_START=1 /DNA_END=210 /DNA_ORIENTATION=-
MCTMLNGRISIRIDGALSLAVYDKAQRLPVIQDDSDFVINNGPGGRKGEKKVYETPEDEAFENEPAHPTE